jgi:CRP/FNR family transcriptional regulator
MQQSDPAQLGLAKFNAGSFIMVEGKACDSTFYIIRSGKVQMQKESELVEEETGNLLHPGDFFGVVSAMSGHQNIETVIALTEVILIVVRKDQFGMLIQKNGPIAMKIIRSFSRKLRYFDSALTRLSFRSATEEDPSHLFSIGEYYNKQKQLPHAGHAFLKYIQFNPNGAFVLQARQRLSQLAQHVKKPQPTGGGTMTRSYADNDVIFLEHEPGDELYIIQQGKVKITKIVENNEIMLAVIGPGDIFGEMALLENKPRSASAISFGESTMLAVNKDNFQNMVSTQPQLATKIITLLSDRIWIMYRQFANLFISDPIGRVYDTLLTQVEKNRVKIERQAQYTFEFGTKELITMVGLPPDKGKIVIRDLLSNNKIKLNNNRIQCTDLEELAKQVSFYRKKSQRDQKLENDKRRI